MEQDKRFDPRRLAGTEIWLSQRQIGELLGAKTSLIADLIRYLYKTGELDKAGTVRKQPVVQMEGAREVTRELNCYNRQVVLAVAWRVHSDPGEQFRQWASKLLEDQLSQGYTLSPQQLAESPAGVASLQQAVEELQQSAELAGDAASEVDSGDQLSQLFRVFRRSLQKLLEFEHNRVALRNTSMLAARPLEYFEVTTTLAQLRESLLGDDEAEGFGIEKPGELEPLLGSVSARRYSSIEQKAVHLLWLVIHRQPFEDGNLQLGAFLFVWFLQRNGLLYRDDGTQRLQDNALVPMVLLAARSSEEECDLLVSLLAGLINREN